jgi:hypothetical protein
VKQAQDEAENKERKWKFTDKEARRQKNNEK